jgi:virginiamycin B lyase
MRIRISFVLPLLVAVGVLQGADKASKTARAKQVRGIATPGVQIPMASLKPAAEIPVPAKPDWMFFADSLFLPGKNALDRIDPKTNKLDEPVTGLEKPCGGMTAGFGSLWVPSCGTGAGGALQRIDSKTLKVSAKLDIGASSATGIVAQTPDSVWMLVDDKTTLARIDPDQNAVVAEIRLPAGCRSLTFGETALWLACPAENKVIRINPITNLVEKQIEVSAEPESISTGLNSVWVYCRKESKVDRIDPKTNKVSKSIELKVPGAEGAIAFGEGSIWVSMPGFPLTRIDPAAEVVAQQFYGDGGGVVRTSAGAIWLCNREAGTLWRIDPKLVVLTLAE